MVYSNSPDSSAFVGSGRSLPDAEYDPLTTKGIPLKCYCGGAPMIKPSFSSAYPGRNSIVCENADEHGWFHTQKWFDEAIMEDMRRIKFNMFPDVKTKLKYIKEDLNAIAHSATNDYITASIDIAKLKQMQHQNDEKIEKLEKLEKLVSEKGRFISAVELQIMLAIMLVVAVVSMYMQL